jgi:hypothetical protein
MVVKFRFHFPHALRAKAIIITHLQVISFLLIKINLGTLAKEDRSHLAFKLEIASHTIFRLMLTHRYLSPLVITSSGITKPEAGSRE